LERNAVYGSETAIGLKSEKTTSGAFRPESLTGCTNMCD
jgi:hypothetical protein